jgi:hypothetical protein
MMSADTGPCLNELFAIAKRGLATREANSRLTSRVHRGNRATSQSAARHPSAVDRGSGGNWRRWEEYVPFR